MSASSFINALKHFAAIIRQAKEYHSERGTSFIGAVDSLQIDATNVWDSDPWSRIFWFLSDSLGIHLALFLTYWWRVGANDWRNTPYTEYDEGTFRSSNYPRSSYYFPCWGKCHNQLSPSHIHSFRSGLIFHSNIQHLAYSENWHSKWSGMWHKCKGFTENTVEENPNKKEL